MTPLPLVVLEGSLVRLEPLSLAHVPALVRAASGGRETFALTSVPDGEAAMTRYVTAALADATAGRALPFATLTARGDVVGSTRFGNVERWSWPDGRPVSVWPDVVEIGWTWLAPHAQRTGVNMEAKRLMLAHAFETWQVRRVTLKTDARNVRSRAAMERIGATFEGILRAHLPASDGGVRDSAMYSVIQQEWPRVRGHLDGLLARGVSRTGRSE